jgi:NAD-dependent SIR2 family protein deacetylase
MNRIENMVRMAEHPVALTGAGISAPSGIPTFQGTWKDQPIRNFLSRDYFFEDYAGFFELFCEMVDWCDKEPNPAHKALAALNIPIITQNVDGLHEKSGAKEVYAMHGTLKTVHCINCKQKQNSSELAARLRPLYQRGDKDAIFEALRCPHCAAISENGRSVSDTSFRTPSRHEVRITSPTLRPSAAANLASSVLAVTPASCASSPTRILNPCAFRILSSVSITSASSV